MKGTLYWLPKAVDFARDLKALKGTKRQGGAVSLGSLRALADHNLDFSDIANVDRLLTEVTPAGQGADEGFPIIRLAILGSSTLEQVLPSLRVACLRRGLLLECYLGAYNQYRQEILDGNSPLYRFKPDVVLLALDAEEAIVQIPLEAPRAEALAQIGQRLDEWAQLWKKVSAQSDAVVIHQTLVVPYQQLLGQLDALTPSTPTATAFHLNAGLRAKAAECGVHLLDVDALASDIGKGAWQDLSLWFHAKQAISPLYAPIYGDVAARLLAAIRGLSKKCLVLDLDNTLWGGVIGDDGLEGIELGHGSAVGEAYSAFQIYVKQLKDRGVILAICSKNDEKAAFEAFDKHPDMVLRREDIAAFIANWDDKATNLKRIAEELQIGVDSLVFFDDNPAERGLVRQLLPAVSVPEAPEDPAWFVPCLSDAGYFESVHFTAEDLKRAAQYQANSQRKKAQESSGTVEDFLKGLGMRMTLSSFDDVGLSRITQLINKSNQFNLTTRRYTEAQVRELAADRKNLTFQIRLKDSYGDHGMISVLIARPIAGPAGKGLLIDTWLMSCRVLGRQVEQTLLNQLADRARQANYAFLRGEYLPTEKNGMVRDHYPNLGFKPLQAPAEPGRPGQQFWDLNLAEFKAIPTFIQCSLEEGIVS